MLDSLIHKPRLRLLELHQTFPSGPGCDICWNPPRLPAGPSSSRRASETPPGPGRTWGIMTIATTHPGSVRLVHSTRPAQPGNGCFTGWGPRVPGV